MSDKERRKHQTPLTNGTDNVLAYARNFQSVVSSIFCQATETRIWITGGLWRRRVDEHVDLVELAHHRKTRRAPHQEEAVLLLLWLRLSATHSCSLDGFWGVPLSRMPNMLLRSCDAGEEQDELHLSRKRNYDIEQCDRLLTSGDCDVRLSMLLPLHAQRR